MLDTDTVREAIDRLAEHVLASMDLARTDRLWPADPMVFQTNALNVAYGACGTALFLRGALGELPADVRAWLAAQPVRTATHPPGLYSGIAGIAWSFAELGMVDRGVELLRLAATSPLAFEAADIFDGCAGWGLAALELFGRTGEEEFREMACRAGDFLLESAERDARGVYWRNRMNGAVPLGFAFGGSGIGFFLLALWKVADDVRYRSAACDAMDFEIAHGVEQGEGLVWASTTENAGYRPYWLRGGAGVATALIRFADLLGEPRYLEVAHRALRPCMTFAAAPHLFEGLASMGESLLDMALYTGDARYADAALEKARQILLFQVHRPSGRAFPGRYLLRISHDYGVGGAGIGLFLQRLLTRTPRLFHDVLRGSAMSLGDRRGDARGWRAR